jgi:hypothetical protein
VGVDGRLNGVRCWSRGASTVAAASAASAAATTAVLLLLLLLPLLLCVADKQNIK